MRKIRLNNNMREDMLMALMTHALSGRIEKLRQEGNDLREEAIARVFTPAQRKAITTLLPFYDGKDEYDRNLNYVGGIVVNAAGIAVHVGVASAPEPFDRACSRYGWANQDAKGRNATPLPSGMNEQRLDCDASDELGQRASAWITACEELKSERRSLHVQIVTALQAFQTAQALEAGWPDAWPVLSPIVEQYSPSGTGAAVPAVLIAELTAKFGLPPELAEAA